MLLSIFLFIIVRMPSPCVVPFCKGNYKSGPKVRVYSFPRDEESRRKWTFAIKRSNFTPTKYSRVCSLHFQESDFEREASAFDPKTGRTLTAPLINIRLKKDAVPSLFNFSDPNKEDQDEIMFENGQSSSTLQQNIACSAPAYYHPKDTKSNSSLENKAENLKKMPGRKKRKRQSENTAVDKINNSPPYNSQETSSDNIVDKNNSSSKSSLSLPVVTVKIEKPWEEEYNYAGKTSVDKPKDCDKLQIEIRDVRSVSSSFSEKDDKNKTEISGSSSVFSRPFKILKREEIFGKLVASELSDLCKSPELYLKTKRAILDILVQAHFEQIKCSSTFL